MDVSDLRWRLPWVVRMWRRVFCMTVDSEFEEEYSEMNVSKRRRFRWTRRH